MFCTSFFISFATYLTFSISRFSAASRTLVACEGASDILHSTLMFIKNPHTLRQICGKTTPISRWNTSWAFCKTLGSGSVESYEPEHGHSCAPFRPRCLELIEYTVGELPYGSNGDVIDLGWLEGVHIPCEPLFVSRELPALVFADPRKIDIHLLIYQLVF